MNKKLFHIWILSIESIDKNTRKQELYYYRKPPPYFVSSFYFETELCTFLPTISNRADTYTWLIRRGISLQFSSDLSAENCQDFRLEIPTSR